MEAVNEIGEKGATLPRTPSPSPPKKNSYLSCASYSLIRWSTC